MRLLAVALTLATAGAWTLTSAAAPTPEDAATAGRAAAPRIEVRAVAEHVERQAPPAPTWIPTLLGDLLAPSQGIRTQERSSTELGFQDGSRLRLSELAVVFVRRLERSGAGALQGTLEVSAGQAELELARPPAVAAMLEVLVGNARVTPRSVSAEPAKLRARHNANGAAQFMLYAGETEVTAGGRAVRLRRGWGTSVAAGETPKAPEPLLEAPMPWVPAPAASFDHSNPSFSWDPQRGAESYTIEICRDPACGELLQRATGLQVSHWTSDDLPLETLYWRVTAVSRAGLDGYPSTARAFSVRALWHRPDATRPSASPSPTATP
jgi:hypothetical protein